MPGAGLVWISSASPSSTANIGRQGPQREVFRPYDPEMLSEAYFDWRRRCALVRIRHLAIPVPPLAEQRRLLEELESRSSRFHQMDDLVNGNILRAAALHQKLLDQIYQAEPRGGRHA